MPATLKTSQTAQILTGLMLAAYGLMLCAAVLLGALKSLAYVAAFLAAVILAVWILCPGPRPAWDALLERLDSRELGAVLALFCLLVNAVWVLLVRVEPFGDYEVFWLSATQLAEGKPVSYAGTIAAFPHILGYSSFLSLFIRLFGPSPLLAPLINVALTVISGVALYTLCLNWRGKRAAAFAFLLWTVCPSRILFNAQVMSEPLYTCLILLFLLLVSQLERRGERMGAYGLTAVASAFVLRGINAARPIAAVPIIAFFIWILLLKKDVRERESLCRWALYSLLMPVLYAGLGYLWDRYAENVLGEAPASTPGYSIYVGFNTESSGTYFEEDMELLRHYREDVFGNAKEAQAQMLEEAKARIASGEINFPLFFAKKLRILLGNDEAGVNSSRFSLSENQYTACAIASNVYYYGLILLSLAGALDMWQKRTDSCALIAPMFVLGLTLAHMLVEVSERYHYSMISMLVIIAAFGLRPRRMVAG